ncbi:MAG: hypothetical protein V3V74_07170 [Nitrosomonadaceae bacterium]
MGALFKGCFALTLLLGLCAQASAEGAKVKARHIEGLEPYEYGGFTPARFYQYSSKDFENLHNVNVERMVLQKLAAHKVMLEKPTELRTVVEKAKLEELKTLFAAAPKLTIKDHFENVASEPLYATDRKNIHVISFAFLHPSETIDYLNKLHDENLFGNVKVRLIKSGTGAGDPERLAKYRKEHLKKSAKMGDRAPRFRIDLDSNSRHFMAFKAFSAGAKTMQGMGNIYIVDKNGSLIWVGNVKALPYYWESIKAGTYLREDFLKAHAAAPDMRKYGPMVGVPKNRSKAITLSEDMLKAFKKSPDLCLSWAGRVRTRDLTHYRDDALILRCLKQANDFTGAKFPEILEWLAMSYFENGRLTEAISTLKKSKTLVTTKEDTKRLEDLLTTWNEVKTKIGTGNFATSKRAQARFVKELWPLLVDRQADKKAAEKLLRALRPTLEQDPYLSSFMALRCFQQLNIFSHNKTLLPFVKKVVALSMTKVSSDRKKQKTEDHIIFAAKAYLENHLNNKDLAISFISRAIALKPHRNFLRPYTAFLRYQTRKKKR